MKVDKLLELIGADFYTGVPDSQLKALINHLMGTYGIDPKHHVIAANEGNCAALAAGYHLATGKVPHHWQILPQRNWLPLDWHPPDYSL